MSLAVIDEQVLQDLGDAIRLKNESQDTYLPSQMPTAVAQLNTSPNAFKQMCLGISVDFTPIEVGGITTVIDYLFYKIPYIGRVDIPSTVTYIGTYSFYETGATSLRVDAPLVTTIGNNAFGNMRSLTTAYINLPLITYNNNFLANSKNLTDLRLVSIGVMGDYFLYGAPKLPHVDIPSVCTAIGTRSFDIAVSDRSTSAKLHVVFLRHAVVDGTGAYTTSPTTLASNLFGNRSLAKLFTHVPLDSLLPYRRQFMTTGTENYSTISRMSVYLDANVGDTLPTTVSQIAEGYEGTYNIAWYVDDEYTTAYSGETADQNTRYFGTVTVVSEQAIS